MRSLNLDRIDGSSVPWLVCLDIQRSVAAEVDPTALTTGQWLLGQARRRRWPVAHLHRRSPAFSDREGLGDAAPVAGFEPLPSEPLFVRSGLSAFSSPRFREWAAAADDDEQIVFLGLGNCATWLATALGGADIGIRPALVEDALGVAALGPMPAEAARHTVFSVTAPFADWTSAAALVDRTLDAHRPRAANQP